MGNGMIAENPFMKQDGTLGNDQEEKGAVETEKDPLDSPLINIGEEDTEDDVDVDESSEVDETDESEEVEEESAPSESSSMVEMMAAMQKQIAEMNQRTSQPQQQERQYTPEEWEQIKEKTGLTQTGFSIMTNQIKQMEQRVFDTFSERLAVMEKRSVMDSLAKQKGFEGIHRHSKNIDKFLENFPKSMHNNEQAIKMAFLSSKGMEADKRTVNAQNATERNRRIVNRINPKGITQIKKSSGKAKSTNGLSPLERQYARSGGMTDAEYLKFKVKR